MTFAFRKLLLYRRAYTFPTKMRRIGSVHILIGLIYDVTTYFQRVSNQSARVLVGPAALIGKFPWALGRYRLNLLGSFWLGLSAYFGL